MFVEFAGDLVDQIKPLRGEDDRPLRALAVEFEEPDPLLPCPRGTQEELVKVDLGYRLAVSPREDTPSARVERIARKSGYP